MEETQSNPRAASVRVHPEKASGYKSQRVHDLRRGKQPAYVNGDLTHLNRTLIEPPTPGALSKICAARRSIRETQRGMKSGTNVAYVGIITFGIEAQVLFRALDDAAQDAAYLEVAQAVADRLNTTVEGLVVHNDESAPHAHMTFPAYDLDGQPLTKSAKRDALLKIQDDLAEIMGRHAPGIERGRSRRARIEAGASVADTINRSVRQLHADLPAEIAAKERELAEASARVDEMRSRVEKLEAQNALTDKEAKRLETYRKRLADRVAAEEAAKAEAERLAQLARDEVETARQERDEAISQEAAARATATRITAAVQVLANEITGDTITRDDAGKIRVSDPAGLQQGFPDLRPAVVATADAMTAKRRLEQDAADDRRKAADALQQAEADAKTKRDAADAVKAEADAALVEAEAAKAESFGLRDKLRSALTVIRLAITRAGRHMPQRERTETDQVIKMVERLTETPTPKKPGDESGGSGNLSM